jgi:gas vesicle protein
MKMISKKDILHALGAETESRFMTGLLVGVGIGALVGSVVAMLVAPRSGSELRSVIGEKGKGLVDMAKTKFSRGEKNDVMSGGTSGGTI